MLNKYDYFIRAIRDNVHLQRSWLLSVFTVILRFERGTPKEHDVFHNVDQNQVEIYLDGKWSVLSGTKAHEIPYVYHEIVPLVKAFDIGNALVDIKDTTWGEMLFNQRVLFYATGTKIPYMQHPVKIGDIARVFSEQMLSDPEDGVFDDDKIYVKNLMLLGGAISDLGNYEFFVPSVDEVGLSAPDNNESLKKELFEKYADQLDDPVIQVKIQDTLVANYKEHIKGSPSEGFIYKPKSINTALKRMFLLHGVEAGFGDLAPPRLIRRSLDQGIDIDEFPTMVNSLRNGAYSRGALTALAGNGVNLIARIFQNALIDVDTVSNGVKGFCGTESTELFKVDSSFEGRYYKKAGSPVLIDSATAASGATLPVYSPLWCKATGNDVCSVCIGSVLSKYPKALGSVVSRIPSVMMDKMMGSAHAKEQVTTRIPNNWIK